MHIVKSASATNSVFALVLGLLAFLYLIATTLLLCAEANMVATDHLYPRALLTPFTDNVELTRVLRATPAGRAEGGYTPSILRQTSDDPEQLAVACA